MRPGDDTTELARQMLARKQSGYERPFILFLGQECADAAGVPNVYTIARQVLADPSFSASYLGGQDPKDPALVLTAFENLLGEMTSGQRYRMLLSFYSSVPVPTFYQDLSLLVKAGYFQHILTTNIDNLLEQALAGAGMLVDRDFEVLVLGQTEPVPWRQKSMAPANGRVSIIKLHGDLAQQQAAITRYEISTALKPQRSFIKGEIAGDMIMVGYQFESEPLNEWLTWVPGEVWWAGAEPDDEEMLRRLEEKRPVHRIYGEGADPEVIFGQLAWLLMRSPAQTVQPAVPEPGRDDAGPGEDVTVENLPGADYSDAAFLATQLRRSRSVLQALEGSSSPGEKNPALDAQIEYQRREIADVEARLRSLEPNRQRVLELMDSVRRSVQRAARKDLVDKNAAAFVRRQWSTVQGEYQRDQPNQWIVAAAIGATVVLGERLGEQVVDREALNQLAAYAPSAVGWRS